MNLTPSSRAPALIRLGIAGLLVLLCISAYLNFRASRRILAASDWVEHTRAVELDTESLGLLLRDAETGQRGLLLTGRDEYLEPYRSAVREIPDRIQHLKALTNDNPVQVRNVETLEVAVDHKMSELAKTVELYEQGRVDEALGLLKSDLGKSQMDQIRKLLEGMKQEEKRLLSERQSEEQRSSEFSNWTFILTTLVAAVGLLLFGRAVSNDAKLRNSAAAAIYDREQWLQTTINSIGDAVIATDFEGRVTFLNPVASELMGYSSEEAKGKPIVEVFPIFNETSGEPVANPIQRVISERRATGLANHTVLKRRDGSMVAIDDSAAPIISKTGDLLGMVLVFRDVSDRRKLESSLRTTEKLAAAGRLAATVAHEINNPLEAVTNIIFLLQGEQALSENGKHMLRVADEQLARVAHTVKQTLAFYRETRQPERVDPKDVFERVLAIYRSKLEGKDIRVERKHEDAAYLWAASGDLVQVFSNLISNAIDAVGDRGSIRITTRVDHTDQDRVLVSVEDDGCGIDPVMQGRVMEPFFTTKREVGTGLGLWITSRIVEGLNGELRLMSEGSGKGAKFTVRLPRYEAASATTAMASSD